MSIYDSVRVPSYLLPKSATLTICGPSGSGKSSFLLALLKEHKRVFQEPIKRILFAYSEMQVLYDEMKEIFPNIEFCKGVPSLSRIEEFCASGDGFSLLIFDDLQLGMESQEITALWLSIAHHRSCYVICLQQSVFREGPNSRLQSINSSHWVFMRSNRDRLMFKHFFSQLNTGKSNVLLTIYDDVMNDTFGPECPPHMWINCHSFENDLNHRYMSHVVCSPYRVVYKPI
jgi:hypothetical protein